MSVREHDEPGSPCANRRWELESGPTAAYDATRVAETWSSRRGSNG